MNNIIDEHKEEFQHVLDFLRSEMNGLRTGRANAAMVEDIPVEAYDSKMDLKGVATITIPDAKTIMVDPWDKALLKDVEKAIAASSLGINPTIDGNSIRLSLPPMTEDGRKELVKVVKKKVEDAHVGIRAVREKIRDAIAKMEKDKEISEDDLFRLREALENTVKSWNEKIKVLGEEKEKEIMTI